jgi:hypothetical protein
MNPSVRRWDMNLTSALARVEFESALDMSNTTAKMVCITLTTSRICKTYVEFNSKNDSGQIFHHLEY